MQQSRLRNLLSLKLLTPIVLNNVINKPKNRLVKKDTYLNKLFSIISSSLLASNVVENAASMIQHGINY